MWAFQRFLAGVHLSGGAIGINVAKELPFRNNFVDSETAMGSTERQLCFNLVLPTNHQA